MEQVVSLTLSLDNFTPKIWRRIWVKGSIRLDKLCKVLYKSMGWSGYHLSEIQTQHDKYGDTEIDSPDYLLDWEDYTLNDLIKNGATQFKYQYDFGDGWEMTIKVKKENKLSLDAPYPVCVNGKNAAPPEDVGGYGGYQHFINVMKNPKHPEFKELSDWFGDVKFDSTHFSIDEINTKIQ